jgi:hypothetical protein
LWAKGIPRSWSKPSKGDRVPEVIKIECGYSARIFEKMKLGAKHFIERVLEEVVPFPNYLPSFFSYNCK